MVQFGLFKISRTFFDQFLCIGGKRHYCSHVSLHEAPTKKIGQNISAQKIEEFEMKTLYDALMQLIIQIGQYF